MKRSPSHITIPPKYLTKGGSIDLNYFNRDFFNKDLFNKHLSKQTNSDCINNKNTYVGCPVVSINPNNYSLHSCHGIVGSTVGGQPHTTSCNPIISNSSNCLSNPQNSLPPNGAASSVMGENFIYDKCFL